MMNVVDHEETVDYEPEDELGSLGALKAKLQKLRNELEAAKKERAEYLDGWQRAKADLINFKRDAAQGSQKTAAMAREAFIAELIPAIDSFDMAMLADSWHQVDSAWRMGIESIRSQIAGVLQSHGIEVFGAAGDVFDPMMHEAIQEIDAPGEIGTVARVLRRGYRAGERIVRPAHVAIITRENQKS